MSVQTNGWLVAYDVRSSKRLAKVHKRLAREGHALQFSLFAVDLTDKGLDSLVSDLTLLIKAEDDVRFIPLSPSSRGYRFGRHLCEDDEVLALGSGALDLLRSLERWGAGTNGRRERKQKTGG